MDVIISISCSTAVSYTHLIWRNIGGHQLTLEEAKELCEKNITSSELEMYREDGSIYRKRLGLAPDKLQIVKI